jgi:hypothetical protein
MNAIELRNKLISLIQKADLNSLKRIESILVAKEGDVDISDEHKLILDERLKEHEANPNSGKSLSAVKEELAVKYGI